MIEEYSLIINIISIIVLLLIAACSAIVFKRIRFPYTVGLVLVGIGLKFLADHINVLEPMRDLHLTPNFILYIIIPILVFDAAVSIDSRFLIKNLTPVLVLSAPGLIISTLIVGGLVAVFTPLPIGPAMLFGALISATDPVAVISLFKELGAPKRLTMLVDGESLFNDATAIVAFNIIFGIVASGAWGMMVFLKGLESFVVVFVGGVVVGAVIGYLMIRIITLAKNDPLIEIAFSTVVAFAAFTVANYYLKVSGVMAVVGAGVVVGWYGFTRFTPETRQYIHQFWEYAAFVANSFIFLLIGFSEVSLIQGFDHYKGLMVFVMYTIAAVTLARAVVVYGLVPLVNRLPGADPIDRRNQTVIFWGGLRGAVPLALALSLASDFAYRQLVMELTLAVVLFTLLVQGTTVSRLIKWFKLDTPTLAEKAGRLQAILAAMRGGLKRISSLGKIGHFPASLIRKISNDYHHKALTAEQALTELRKDPAFLTTAIPQILWSQAINLEQQTCRMFFERGFISESVLQEFQFQSDLQKERLGLGEIPPRLVDGEPIILRIRNWGVNMVDRLAPGSRFIRSHRIRTIAARYEKNIFRIEMCRRVMASLDHFAELCEAQPSVVAKCRQYYEEYHNTALQDLETQIKQFPQYVDVARTRTLYRVALDGEFEAVEEFASSGTISDKDVSILQGDIENALEILAQQESKG